MLAEQVDYVVGVDTHRDQHALAIVDAHTGAVIAQTTTAASARGYADAVASRIGTRPALASGRSRAPATTAPGLSGTCSASAANRCMRSTAPAAASGGCAAKTTSSTQSVPPALPSRTSVGQDRERASIRRRCGCCCWRRRTAVDTRRVALVQLRSVIVTAPDGLRDELRRLPLGELLNRCSRFRRSSSRTPAQLATILVLRTLARRIQAATAEAETLEREILSHVRALVPELLDEPGIGPIVAAQLIVSWSHHDRIDSEACFARLAGVAPLPASSGQTTRHRLSRGGDRQLNRALHTVVLHRRQHDPATRDYIARRIAEGKTSRDATRLLKRYLARHLYRVMQNSTPLTT